MNMLATLRARREDDERGFTLIELIVVVLIIAILIAIAIPTFLGARNRASDRAAQSNLRNALTAAKTAFTDNDQYPANAGLPAALKTIEPSLDYFADTVDVSVAPAAGSHAVSVQTNAGLDTFVAAAYAKDSKTCFWIADVSPNGTFYNTNNGGGGPCTAGGAPANITTWPTKW
jgi:type IV pilus assembly protein PilA